MIVVELTYQCDLETVDLYLAEHRLFLAEAYAKKLFLASGPKPGRTGGVIIVDMDDIEACKKLMQQDPFYKNKLATYHYLPFTASMRA